MVYASLGIYMLARSYGHVLGRSDVSQGGLAWVGVRNPYGDGEAVGGAPEDDGDRTREVDEESGDAIVKSYRVREHRLEIEVMNASPWGPRGLMIVLWTSVLGDIEGYCDNAWATSL